MLYNLPPFRGPSFQLLESKYLLESPDQEVSSKPHFRSFAHTYSDIWRLKKCSTIRLCPGATFFSF